MSLVWKTNFGNPYKPNYSPMPFSGETIIQALCRERRIFDSMIKGRPKGSKTCTVEELEAMGMVGLYREES